ncbi:hypothetical protein SAMN05216588_109172 [Pseudomonas flavescens]|uniref:Uncharacterized protein n=1 Tax=Phytopseudomonas flavescens TaxID=29435 RepID=A0A1G8GSJ1_9GAMM|nr:hypothetical protein [Pseudomonas flavescens]SDH97329.1 hypothetical protein SAMN05216588_109172 [Pseudomonas flavescens]
METEFSTTIWEWYADDEYKKLLSFCELCSGLEFLAMEPEAQSSSTPSCPGCEVWYEKMLCIQQFVDDFGRALPASSNTQLKLLFELCENLSDEAYHCNDQFMFHHKEWECVRHASRVALDGLGWSKLKAYIPEFEGRSRNVLYGVAYTKT